MSTALAKQVDKVVANTPVFDIHTHLYDPAFRELLLWGIDDLLTYHYLVAEAFRYFDFPPEKFWSLPRTRRADLIWNALFAQRSPISIQENPPQLPQALPPSTPPMTPRAATVRGRTHWP